MNKKSDKFSVIIYNYIYEQKTQCRTFMSALTMY